MAGETELPVQTDLPRSQEPAVHQILPDDLNSSATPLITLDDGQLPQSDSQSRPASNTQPSPANASSLATLSPTPGPVLLTWTPEDNSADVGSSNADTSAESSMAEATFTFSQLSRDSMLVLPSSDAIDSRPRYHISVLFNIFYPASWMTTIRRGSSEVGEYVGEFLIGSSEADVVRIGRKELDIAFALHSKRNVHSWKWNPNRKFRWKLRVRYNFTTSESNGEWACELCNKGQEEGPVIATYAPTPRYNRQTVATAPRTVKSFKPPTLKVKNRALNELDEILMSLLLFERSRLTPSLMTSD